MDQNNRVVILRGLNLSQHHKIPDFKPNTDPNLFKKIKNWGVNIIRHQFNWEAYEPERSNYDSTYLQYFIEVTERAISEEIYVIIDIHQDCYSRFFLDGCGEGFPKWSLPPDIIPDDPDNGKSCKYWPLKTLFNKDLKFVFNQFYKNVNGIRDEYLKMINVLAKSFSDNKYVIGYDMLNEPHGDSDLLREFYEIIMKEIRTEDPDAIAFVSPLFWHGNGFTSIKLEKPNFNNIAFSPHYYDVLGIISKYLISPNLNNRIKHYKKTADEWDSALFIGEFGTPPISGAMKFIDKFYNSLDNYGVSSAQWGYTQEWTKTEFDGWNFENYSIVDDTENLRGNFRVRPYITKTAGKNPKVKCIFNGNKSFQFIWDHEPSKGVTEIFFPFESLFGEENYEIIKKPSELNCDLNHIKQTIYCTYNENSSVAIKINQLIFD